MGGPGTSGSWRMGVRGQGGAFPRGRREAGTPPPLPPSATLPQP